ncbi:mitochondrial carrier [Acaromyces ingoldii]|uniref:Mitochondrial carrier n=1 Tax=Acaromyces ingoldii TaxID=215250 RepID=A0A316YQC9_9BASI|nr:mitochondrial carrier [Acaromyces ingoldii]PWN90243.1 mitochondrial carrier [Acaromyces ingoldii]
MDTANQGLRLKRRVLRKLKSGVDQEQDYDDNDDDDDDDEEGRDDSGEGVLATLHDLKRKGEELVGGEEEAEEEESAVSAAFLVSYFLAGGAAGATSRTVVSPLERLKIIMQVQPKSMKGDTKPHKGAYSGVVSGLVKMWQEEGFKGFMRGNGINCLRIAPYSAVQFSSYEILKNYLKDKDGELDVPRRLTAGALAGIASVVSTYPLDLVRSRISIASASLYADAKAATGSLSEPPVDSKPKRKPSRAEVRRIIEERQKKVPGIWAMTVKVYREEGGIRALYKGCVPTSAGVAPYVAINFAAYEALRKRLANEDGEISTVRKLSCGALAGSISQTLTYPLDVLRRRMQVSGMKDSKLGYSDKSSFAAIRTIVTREGFFGLYRGIVPNLLKVAPSIGTSFVTYEFVQQLVHPHPPHHHHDNSSETNNGNGHSKHH